MMLNQSRNTMTYLDTSIDFSFYLLNKQMGLVNNIGLTFVMYNKNIATERKRMQTENWSTMVIDKKGEV